MSKVENGNTISVHYVGTLDDGTEFDNSRARDVPMTCQVGEGKLISGFNDALIGMEIGEKKNISIGPTDAYGSVIEEAIQTVQKTSFPDGFEFEVGNTVQGQGPDGKMVRAAIESLNEDEVVLNFNHPMAGKNLNFEIELLEIQ
jgi:FKBP-type peptidyl-prolyl cis-trans isomerase 2